ncbi:MAG TPA: NAD-dependent protein deacetylase [Vicinamibacteria bacterium]|nr:NAD-dependent protein deacetylase [Vicinamibacteria bacterium]
MSEAGSALASFVRRHRRLLVLTGAGCSTASGIPDYRDHDGAWRHARPMGFAEFTGSAAARRRYWAGSLRGWPRVRDARPNPAHAALAGLEACGRVCRVVTQNVDGLHQRAGSRRVTDLHGRLDVVECLGCGCRVGREDLQALLVAWNRGASGTPSGDPPPGDTPPGVDAEVRPDGDTRVTGPLAAFRVPDCPECGGVLKPGVVFFGENVPAGRVREAFASLEDADGLLVVGSSLMVFSGYRFVRAARERGLEVAALNLGRTRADAELTLKVEGDCAALLPLAVGSLEAVFTRANGP